MKGFDVVSKLSEATAVVLSDESGSLLQWVGDIDGETAGAMHAFAQQSMRQAGDLLGIGDLERVTIISATQACVIVVQDAEVLGVYSPAGKPFLILEKKLDAALGR